VLLLLLLLVLLLLLLLLFLLLLCLLRTSPVTLLTAVTRAHQPASPASAASAPGTSSAKRCLLHANLFSSDCSQRGIGGGDSTAGQDGVSSSTSGGSTSGLCTGSK
jgi:hypothetical protein